MLIYMMRKSPGNRKFSAQFLMIISPYERILRNCTASSGINYEDVKIYNSFKFI